MCTECACNVRHVEIVGRSRVEGKSVARDQCASLKFVPQCASTSCIRAPFFDVGCALECAIMCYLLILAHFGTFWNYFIFNSNFNPNEKRQGIKILGKVV